jgi:hypothetical protein
MVCFKAILVVICVVGKTAVASAGFESAQVFPSSTELWFHVSDMSEVSSRIANGPLGESLGKILRSPDGTKEARSLGLNGFTNLPWSDLSVLELMTLPKKEFAFGHFYENDARKWCLLIDADDERVGVQIFCLNLEKKLIAQGGEKKEWRIGDNNVVAFISDGTCLAAFVERGSQFLFCNSTDMISEMTIRWVNQTNDGLMSESEFVSSMKSMEIEKRGGVHLFIRGKHVFPTDEYMRLALRLNTPYGLYPLIEAHGKSMLIALSFPPKPGDVEAELHVQFCLNDEVELLKQPAKASFSETDPFASYDAIGYTVVSADFWRIPAESLKEDLKSSVAALRRMEELAKAKNLSVNDLLANSQNDMDLLPVVYMCILDGGAEAVIYKPRKNKASFAELLSSRIPSDSIKNDGRDGSFWKIDQFKGFAIPASLSMMHEPLPKFKGVRGDYYIESNSDRFFTETEMQPDDTLHDSIPFKIVKRVLMERSAGDCFAIQYWDVGRYIESNSKQLQKSGIANWMHRRGLGSFVKLLPLTAECFGHGGGFVKKNQIGFRLEYFLLRR